MNSMVLTSQYEGGACVRCKAGGWRCIRTRADVECKRTLSANDFGQMETMEEEDDESPAPIPRPKPQNSFPFTTTNVFDFNSGSTTTPTDPLTKPHEDDDTTMNEDPWLSMDLDSLLAQSLPPIDMSLYQSMGDLAPIHSETVPYGQDDFSSYLYPSTGTNQGSSSSMLTSTSTFHNGLVSLGTSLSTPITPQVRGVLSEFCEPCCEPAVRIS
jgi:hypothetical protein